MLLYKIGKNDGALRGTFVRCDKKVPRRCKKMKKTVDDFAVIPYNRAKIQKSAAHQAAAGQDAVSVPELLESDSLLANLWQIGVLYVRNCWIYRK